MHYVLLFSLSLFILFIPGLLFLYIFSGKDGLKRGRILVSPLLSLAIIALIYVTLTKLQVPFSLTWFYGLLSLLGLTALVIFVLRNPDITAKAHIHDLRQTLVNRFIQYRFLLMLLIPSLLLFSIQVYGFWGSDFFMTGDDGLYHYQMIRNILSSGKILNGSFYPFELHTYISVLYQITGFSIDAIWISNAILVVSLLPVFVAYLTYVLSKNRKLAGYSGILSPLFTLIPLNQYYWGGIPYLWGLVMLWVVLGYFFDALENKSYARLAVSVMIFCSLFLLHPPEFITAFIFIFAFIVVNRKFLKEKLFWFWGILLICSLGLLYLLIRFKGISSELIVINAIPLREFFGRMKNFYDYSLKQFLICANLTFISLFVTGIVVFLKKYQKHRAWQVVFLYFFCVGLFFIDLVFFKLLKHIYQVVYPWGDPFRFFEYMLFPFCFFCSVGLEYLVTFIQKSHRQILKNLVLYLVLVFAISPLIIELVYLRNTVVEVSPNKEIFTAATWISEHLSNNKVLLNEGMEGVMSGNTVYRAVDFVSWIEVFTDHKLAFPYIQQPKTSVLAERMYAVNHLNELGINKKVQDIITRDRIGYVIWSEKEYFEREHVWKIEDLKQNKSLKEIYATSTECQKNTKMHNCIFIFEIQDF